MNIVHYLPFTEKGFQCYDSMALQHSKTSRSGTHQLATISRTNVTCAVCSKQIAERSSRMLRFWMHRR